MKSKQKFKDRFKDRASVKMGDVNMRMLWFLVLLVLLVLLCALFYMMGNDLIGMIAAGLG